MPYLVGGGRGVSNPIRIGDNIFAKSAVPAAITTVATTTVATAIATAKTTVTTITVATTVANASVTLFSDGRNNSVLSTMLEARKTRAALTAAPRAEPHGQ